MAVIVQKYGGSSVATVEKLGRVADKVVETRAEGHDVVVVVSAMGKTTDELLMLARQVDENPPRRELDMLLTTGERVSMSLLSMAIHKRGSDAISFTGSQSGIITNDRHFDARIIEVRPHRVEDELARGRVVIVAGYQGMSYRREITTLGRGGSDTTALAMAAALGAERAEIYSDIDGVYTADPHMVEDARHLPELSLEMMQEMAEAGAKVLHAAALEFARKAGIRIHARSTFGSDRETVVHGAAEDTGSAVVGQRALVRVSVRGGSALRTALELVAAAGISPRDVDAAEDGGTFFVALGTTPSWTVARERLFGALGERLTVEDGLGMASVVSSGRGDAGAAVLDLGDALGSDGIRPVRVWSASRRTSALLRDDLVERAVRVLHARLY